MGIFYFPARSMYSQYDNLSDNGSRGIFLFEVVVSIFERFLDTDLVLPVSLLP